MRRLLFLALLVVACSSDEEATGGLAGAGGLAGGAGGLAGGAGSGGSGGSGRYELRRSTGARRARDFIDSIGVNVHLGYTDTPYWDFDLVRSRLLELGVHHVRDGLPAPESLEVPDTVSERLQELGKLGIRSTLIVGYEPSLPDLEGDLPVRLGRALELADALAAIESTNEPDIQTDPNWLANSITWQTALHERLRNDDAFAALSTVPLLAPSVVGDDAAAELRAAAPNIGELADFGNVHPYPGGLAPETNVHRAVQRSRTYLARIPVMATETGYHTALAATDGHPPISEEAEAIYLPRLFAEYFRAGVARSFAYELLDEFEDPGLTNREAHFGLLRRDGTPKPAFTALANLIELLSDAGTDFPPDGIQVWSSDRDVRQLVLQKEDGTFWIALWRNLSLWDTSVQQPIESPTKPVTLSFLKAPASLQRYEPSISLEPTPITPALDVTLEVGASLVLLAVGGMPLGGDAVPGELYELDDFADFTSAGVSIDHTITGQHDFDDALVVRDADGAELTFAVPLPYDFALRTYFFCHSCVGDPPKAVTAEISGDNLQYWPMDLTVVDRQPTLDGRETMTFVPTQPLDYGSLHVRIRLAAGAPLLGEITFFE